MDFRFCGERGLVVGVVGERVFFRFFLVLVIVLGLDYFSYFLLRLGGIRSVVFVL